MGVAPVRSGDAPAGFSLDLHRISTAYSLEYITASPNKGILDFISTSSHAHPTLTCLAEKEEQRRPLETSLTV